MASKDIKLSDLPEPKLEDLPSPGQGVSVDSLPAPEKEPEEQPKEEWSKAESLGQGALQGSTLGFSDELAGAEGALQEKALNKINKLRGKPTTEERSLEDLYKEYRDVQRQKNQEAEEANPKTYLAGQVGGGIGSAALAPAALAPKSLAGMTALGATAGLGSSNADLTKYSPEELKRAGIDVGLGAGLGALGYGAGKLVQKALNPEELEAAGSKMATKAAGIDPTEEFTKLYNPETGKVATDVYGTKGIGKTLVEEGALPTTGGPKATYVAAQSAIEKNSAKLQPLFNSTQQKLDSQLSNSVEKTGHIGQKISDLYNNFQEKLPDSIKDSVNNKLGKYKNLMSDLVDSEGNLNKLNTLKQRITSSAEALSPDIYDVSGQVRDSATFREAQFLKQMGGVVRSHIEELAATVDPQAAQAIQQTNATIGNLLTAKDAAWKQLGLKSGNVSASDVALSTAAGLAAKSTPVGMATLAAKKGVELGTGQSIGRTAGILGAKGTLGLAKGIEKVSNTPAGKLIQKVLPSPKNIIEKAVISPFTQEKVQTEGMGQSEEQNQPQNGKAEATSLSSSLYNATDDSLKEVSKTMSSTPGLQHYGEALNKAIDSGDENAKNRSIFLIMQNPQSRKMVTPE